MKIALINGSPKAKNSASEQILNTLKHMLSHNNEISEYNFRTCNLQNQDLENLEKCQVLVFALPLYVDGIPSHLLNCLYELENYFNKNTENKITVYALVNSGFYEGHQNSIALSLMKNWCVKSNLSWGQGIGIGGGGMFSALIGVPEDKGPKKNLYVALKTMSYNITTKNSADNIFISPNFPRFAYKLSAEMGWRQQAKKNGLKRKDLFYKCR